MGLKSHHNVHCIMLLLAITVYIYPVFFCREDIAFEIVPQQQLQWVHGLMANLVVFGCPQSHADRAVARFFAGKVQLAEQSKSASKICG